MENSYRRFIATISINSLTNDRLVFGEGPYNSYD